MDFSRTFKDHIYNYQELLKQFRTAPPQACPHKYGLNIHMWQIAQD